MIINVTRNSGIVTTIKYASVNKTLIATPAQKIAGSVFGRVSDQIAIFKYAARFRQDIKKPIIHFMISLHLGEHISDKSAKLLAIQFLRLMGFSVLTPWVAYKHEDSHYSHYHIVICRIGLDASLYRGDEKVSIGMLLKAVGPELEERFSLIKNSLSDNSRCAKKRFAYMDYGSKPNAYHEDARSVQDVIDNALREPTTWPRFRMELSTKKVEIILSIDERTQLIRGISYRRLYAFKASDLGHSYTLNGMLKRGLFPPSRAELLSEGVRVNSPIQRGETIPSENNDEDDEDMGETQRMV